MLNQVHMYIKGDVIGVGFRAWLKIQSKIHYVHGWVRNAHDKEQVFGPGGGVETVIQGEQKDLDMMVELAKQGPPVSRVDDVEVFWQEPKEIYEGFEIRK